MKNRFYLDIQLRAQHNMDVKTKTQIFSNIHRLLKGNKITDVALGFPDFGQVNAVGLQGLGEQLRLVSPTADHLHMIKNNVTHRALADLGIIKFSKVLQVPRDSKECRFYRDQSPGRVKQGMRGRGEKTTRDYSGIDKSSSSLLIQRPDGSKYPIFVALMLADEFAPGEFSTYGLSTKTGATFPIF